MCQTDDVKTFVSSSDDLLYLSHIKPLVVGVGGPVGTGKTTSNREAVQTDVRQPIRSRS